MPLFWCFDDSNILSTDAQQALPWMAAGIESWMTVCGVYIAHTDDRSKAQLVVRFVGELWADRTAPNNPVQYQLWHDGEELGLTDEPVNDPPGQLVMRLNPNPTALSGWNAQTIEEVTRHEAGHFLGFDHSVDGAESCMEGNLDRRINTQTPYDVAVAQAIYGPPLATAA
jgi:hypothetical protein